jgi:hypothetical protein
MVGPDYERHDASAPVAVRELAERRVSEPAAVRFRAKIALSRRASMPIYDQDFQAIPPLVCLIDRQRVTHKRLTQYISPNLSFV